MLVRCLLSITTVYLVLLASVGVALAQWTAEKPGSDNIKVLSHLPLGQQTSVADIDLEQEVDRPYAYVGRVVYGAEGEKGLDIIDLHDPENAKRIYSWRIEDQDLHLGMGGMDVKHFKWKGRYYVVQSLQFGQGGPNPNLGAVVLDVTGLPDPSTVKEVGRIHEPDYPGGFHNIFIYKHSNDAVLLFTDALRTSSARLRPRASGGRRHQQCARREGPRTRRRGARHEPITISMPDFIRTARRIDSTEVERVATTCTTSPTLSSPSSSSL